MLQNIKADVIYFKTSTDFEMEFNLCGCCRIRLLTDKAPDKKTLGAALTRAVSRSKIIFVVGSLFGDDGIISLISTAINKELKEIDNKAYGISNSDVIKLPKDALPLVTSDGVFGGCLIVSGPQTMVLLSESKNVRKTVMQTLVHPYVTELATVRTEGGINAIKEKAAENADENTVTEAVEIDTETDTLESINESDFENISEETDTEEEAESIPTEEHTQETFEENNSVVQEKGDNMQEKLQDDKEIILEDSAELQETIELDEDFNEIEVPKETALEKESGSKKELEPCSEDDLILIDGMDYETDDEVVAPQEDFDPGYDLFTNPTRMSHRDATRYNESYANYDGVEDTMVTEASTPNQHKSSLSLNVCLTVVVALLLVLIAVLCYFVFYIPTKEGVSITSYIRDTFGIFFT